MYHNHTYRATRLGTLSVATGFPMAIIMYTDAFVLKFKAINRQMPTDLHCIQSDNQQSRQMKASSPVCNPCDEVGTKKKNKTARSVSIFRTTIQRILCCVCMHEPLKNQKFTITTLFNQSIDLRTEI